MLEASKIIATAAVITDRAVPLPVDPEVGGMTSEVHPLGKRESATGVEDRGGGARGEAVGGTLINLRCKALSNPQSLETCFGFSQMQIGQIPLPPRACFCQVFIPLSPCDLQSQSKGEFQTVPMLLVWAADTAGTQDGGLDNLSPQRGSLRMKEAW